MTYEGAKAQSTMNKWNDNALATDCTVISVNVYPKKISMSTPQCNALLKRPVAK